MKIAKLKMEERKKEMICRHLSSCSISIEIVYATNEIRESSVQFAFLKAQVGQIFVEI